MRILAVDNDKDTGVTLQALLSGQPDMSVDIAFSGREALDKMAVGARYDLVILDIMMPEVSGLDVIKLMSHNERFRGIPILIMSSALPLPPQEFLATIQQTGESPQVKGVIEKPFILADVVEAINKATA